MIPPFENEAVWPENEEVPYHVLPAGFHPCDLDEFICRFVSEFPSSSTRPAIYDGFRRLRLGSEQNNIHLIQWVGGSMTSDKLNPQDIDLCNIVDAQKANDLSASGRAWLRAPLDAREYARGKYKAHTFVIYWYPVGHPKRNLYEGSYSYWLMRYGYTRRLLDEDGTLTTERHPKGIICIVCGDPQHAPPLIDESMPHTVDYVEHGGDIDNG